MAAQNTIASKYTSIIIENQYFGTVNWYKMLFQEIDIIIEQYEAYPKTSFRNRCVIAGSNGLISLSVPLEKGRSQKAIFKDVKISNQQAWQEQHWRSIVSCYGKSPFFEYYRDGMETLFQKRFVYLIDLDLEILAWVKKQLKLTKSAEPTQSYQPQYEETTLDLRDLVKPSQFQEVINPVIYQQVFEDRIGFQPNLSIIDLLCCTGPAAKSFLGNNILTI
jgi:hypothetical protein